MALDLVGCRSLQAATYVQAYLYAMFTMARLP